MQLASDISMLHTLFLMRSRLISLCELCEEILSRLKCVQLMMVFFNILIILLTLVVAMSANAAVVEDMVFL